MADTIEETVRLALKEVKDPEIGMDVVELNLIRDIKVDQGIAKIIMTLTTPMCPYGPAMVEMVKDAARKVEGVKDAIVELSFDPPWEPTAEIKMMLGI